MTSQEERRGTLAYEAYAEAREWESLDGSTIPQWDDNDNQGVKDAWIAAANAVWNSDDDEPEDEEETSLPPLTSTIADQAPVGDGSGGDAGPNAIAPE